MINYDKTLWENNKTVVDADKLNNIENQVNTLTNVSADSNNRLSTVEEILPMKSNIGHSHDNYAMRDHTHEDLATDENLNTLSNDLTSLKNNFELLKEELILEFKKYFDDVSIEENILSFSSNGKVLRSIELPKTSPKVQAICGEALCGDILVGQGLSQAKAVVNPTMWQDGVTPINAENMNKIENKISNLFTIVEQMEVGTGSKELHIGNSEPEDKTLLWVDNDDEDLDNLVPNELLEQIANTLKNHNNQIKELFYLTDAYLDDGEFTDPEDGETTILDGGIF